MIVFNKCSAKTRKKQHGYKVCVTQFLCIFADFENKHIGPKNGCLNIMENMQYYNILEYN